MTRIKGLLAGILLIFFISGCTQHAGPVPITGSMRLKQIIAGTTTKTFYYNSTGQINAFDTCYGTDCFYTDILYDTSNRIEYTNVYEDGSLYEAYAYNYNTSGFISSIDRSAYMFSTPGYTTTEYTHDTSGNTLTASVGPTGGTLTLTDEYQYNAEGQITYHRNTLGPYSVRTTTYTYNTSGQLVRSSFFDSYGGPHLYHAIFEYNTAGQMTRKTNYTDTVIPDVLQRYTDYYYDTYGNLVTEIVTNADASPGGRTDYIYETVY